MSIYIYLSISIHTFIHLSIYTFVYIYMYIYTYTHTLTHTHISYRLRAWAESGISLNRASCNNHLTHRLGVSSPTAARASAAGLTLYLSVCLSIYVDLYTCNVYYVIGGYGVNPGVKGLTRHLLEAARYIYVYIDLSVCLSISIYTHKHIYIIYSAPVPTAASP